MSLIDLKAGFHNIPLPYETQLKVSFICHRGRYKWLRMPFGLQEAPAHFQWVMESILGRPGETSLPVSIYLDDIGLRGDDMDQLLADSVTAIGRLAEAGCMINLAKSVIGTTSAKVVGQRWHSGGYFFAEGKSLASLLDATTGQLSRMSVQRIYGILNFYREYVLDFASVTEPIR